MAFNVGSVVSSQYYFPDNQGNQLFYQQPRASAAECFLSSEWYLKRILLTACKLNVWQYPLDVVPHSVHSSDFLKDEISLSQTGDTLTLY